MERNKRHGNEQVGDSSLRRSINSQVNRSRARIEALVQSALWLTVLTKFNNRRTTYERSPRRKVRRPRRNENRSCCSTTELDPPPPQQKSTRRGSRSLSPPALLVARHSTRSIDPGQPTTDPPGSKPQASSPTSAAPSTSDRSAISERCSDLVVVSHNDVTTHTDTTHHRLPLTHHTDDSTRGADDDGGRRQRRSPAIAAAAAAAAGAVHVHVDVPARPTAAGGLPCIGTRAPEPATGSAASAYGERDVQGGGGSMRRWRVRAWLKSCIDE
jgi:hypothetical protein